MKAMHRFSLHEDASVTATPEAGADPAFITAANQMVAAVKKAVKSGKIRTPAVFRPMTAEEKVADQANTRGEITERQAARLLIQAYIYRRQMPAHLVPSAPPPGYVTPKQRALSAR